MAPNLPPKNARATPETIKALREGLTSVIAGHPGSIQLWTFYERIDAYLGPWGNQGYPIAYGKHYCKLFNENEKLRTNPQTADWVRRTTVALQEPLRDFIVDRFSKSTLATVTEAELRRVAFDVHPKAYTDGGLAMVTLVAPELLWVVVSIPSKEFKPSSNNFDASVKQVFETIGLVAPMATGTVIAAAMPAHSGLLRNAAARDRAALARELNTARWLEDALRTVNSGRMDDISLLNNLTARLNATQFNDQGFARRAREVIQAADARKRKIAAYYRKLIGENPAFKSAIDAGAPGWSQW